MFFKLRCNLLATLIYIARLLKILMYIKIKPKKSNGQYNH